MRTFRKKITKISKGYRLKPETHRLIHKIQRSINGDQDEAIMAACLAYFSSMENNNPAYKNSDHQNQRRVI